VIQLIKVIPDIFKRMMEVGNTKPEERKQNSKTKNSVSRLKLQLSESSLSKEVADEGGRRIRINFSQVVH
jgi:molybdopterin-biosynthesis enzyme MoeA-like protein